MQSHRNKCFALTLLAFPSVHVQASPALLEVLRGGDCPETSFTSNRKDMITGSGLAYTSLSETLLLVTEMGHHPEEGERELSSAASTVMVPVTD